MADKITIWTLDWVPMPDGPADFVRDLRLRWACEEAGLSYTVRTVPIGEAGPDHLARQPFGQVPFMTDGNVQIFESGACVLHLAEKSEILTLLSTKRSISVSEAAPVASRPKQPFPANVMLASPARAALPR